MLTHAGALRTQHRLLLPVRLLLPHLGSLLSPSTTSPHYLAPGNPAQSRRSHGTTPVWTAVLTRRAKRRREPHRRCTVAERLRGRATSSNNLTKTPLVNPHAPEPQHYTPYSCCPHTTPASCAPRPPHLRSSAHAKKTHSEKSTTRILGSALCGIPTRWARWLTRGTK